MNKNSCSHDNSIIFIRRCKFCECKICTSCYKWVAPNNKTYMDFACYLCADRFEFLNNLENMEKI